MRRKQKYDAPLWRVKVPLTATLRYCRCLPWAVFCGGPLSVVRAKKKHTHEMLLWSAKCARDFNCSSSPTWSNAIEMDVKTEVLQKDAWANHKMDGNIHGCHPN